MYLSLPTWTASSSLGRERWCWPWMQVLDALAAVQCRRQSMANRERHSSAEAAGPLTSLVLATSCAQIMQQSTLQLWVPPIYTWCATMGGGIDTLIRQPSASNTINVGRWQRANPWVNYTKDLGEGGGEINDVISWVGRGERVRDGMCLCCKRRGSVAVFINMKRFNLRLSSQNNGYLSHHPKHHIYY